MNGPLAFYEARLARAQVELINTPRGAVAEALRRHEAVQIAQDALDDARDALEVAS